MREKINDRRIERQIISKDNIREFLGSLNGEKGEIDILWDMIEGMPVEEIAKRNSITKSKVTTRMERIRKKAKTYLG